MRSEWLTTTNVNKIPVVPSVGVTMTVILLLEMSSQQYLHLLHML